MRIKACWRAWSKLFTTTHPVSYYNNFLKLDAFQRHFQKLEQDELIVSYLHRLTCFARNLSVIWSLAVNKARAYHHKILLYLWNWCAIKVLLGYIDRYPTSNAKLGTGLWHSEWTCANSTRETCSCSQTAVQWIWSILTYSNRQQFQTVNSPIGYECSW